MEIDELQDRIAQLQHELYELEDLEDAYYSERYRKAEKQRRASLTPVQRDEEDAYKENHDRHIANLIGDEEDPMTIYQIIVGDQLNQHSVFATQLKKGLEL